MNDSFYPFITYRYGWLQAWSAGMPHLTPLYVAAMDDDTSCDFVCPAYVDTKERVLTAAVGVTPGFISSNVNPDEAVAYLIAIAREKGLRKIVLQIPPGYSYCNNLMRHGFVLKHKASFYVLPLTGFRTFDDYLASIRNKGKKSDIKFTMKSGLKSESGGYSPRTFQRFKIFLEEMAVRNGAGLPGDRLYSLLHEYYPNDGLYWIATHYGLDVGSALTFACRDRLWIMWLQGGERYRNLKVDTFLYAEIIQYAIENGYKVVNFGTSPMDTALGDFKRRMEARLEFHEHYELDLHLAGVIRSCAGSVKRFVKARNVSI